jgi:hypothetical protein
VKSVVLVPYCPIPADTGGKVEMWKHLDVLRELGPCTILSAATKPVGGGWTARTRSEVEARGFKVVLRDEECPQRSWRQCMGIAYAAVCKGLRMEKAFGHSNPYHRFAFDPAWFYRHTQDADIAVINYSYWAHLPSAVPKALVLLDLWSPFMWEGGGAERRDIGACDTIFVISKDEQQSMSGWGLQSLVWSPPAVEQTSLPLTDKIGLVGSDNKFNIEGLRWLERAATPDLKVRVYGKLANHIQHPAFEPVGYYEDNIHPYRECGVILFTTIQGMGVQIKTIEALAAGRAIVARRGAVRGLPVEPKGWIDVDCADEMRNAALRLRCDRLAMEKAAMDAKLYYQQRLDAVAIKRGLRQDYVSLASTRMGSGNAAP